MKICPVASSSKGNMYLITHQEHTIMVDAGINGTSIQKYCKSLCGDLSHLSAIFITHTHGDHCSGLNVFSNKYQAFLKKTPQENLCTVYSGEKTSFYLAEGDKKLSFPVKDMKDGVQVGPFRVESIYVPHDAINLAFLITCGDEKLGICTDLGYIEDEVLDFFQGVQVMVLEANYDPDMLRNNSKYPADTKNRIFGKHGHLSNEDAAWAACELCEDGLNTIIFAHLSEENNSYELVETSFQEEMKARGKDYPCRLVLAPEKAPVAWYEVGTGEEILL